MTGRMDGRTHTNHVILIPDTICLRVPSQSEQFLTSQTSDQQIN